MNDSIEEMKRQPDRPVAGATPSDDSMASDLPHHEVLCGLVAVAVAAISFAWCWETSVQPGPELARMLGLSLFLICLPYMLRCWKPHWQPPVLGLIAFVGVILLGAILPEGLLEVVRIGLVIAGGLLALFVLGIWLRRVRARSIPMIVVIALLYTLAVSGQIWRQGFRHPLLVYDLAANGIVTPDALHQPLVIGMLQSYGVPSSGLDGTPVYVYHFGTHWCFAQLARLLGVTALEIIHLGYAMLLVPLGLWAALKLIVAVQDVLNCRPVDWNRPLSGPQHLFLLLGFVGPMPTFMIASRLFEWSLFFSTEWGWFFPSESQALGLMILLLLLAFGISRYCSFDRQRSTSVWSQMAFESALTVIVAASLAWIKITIAHLAFLALLYLTVRLRPRRRLIVMTIFYAATLFIISRLFSRPYEDAAIRIAPLKLWWEKIPLGMWPIVPVQFSLSAIVYVGLRCAQLGLHRLEDVVAAIRQRRLVDVEVVALLTVAGVAATILLGGYAAFNSLYYQKTVGLVCLLAGVGALGAWQSTRGVALGGRLHQWRQWRLADVCVAAMLLVGVSVCTLNTMQWLRNAAWINIQSRGDGVAVPVGRFSEPGKPGMRAALHAGDLGQLADYVDANTDALEKRLQHGDRAFLRVLAELGTTLTPEEKRETALWIPKTNREYWELTNKNRRFIPFVAGALSSLALIDGLPEINRRRDYGFDSYPELTRSAADSLTREEVLTRARELGYRQVIELRKGGVTERYLLGDTLAWTERSGGISRAHTRSPESRKIGDPHRQDIVAKKPLVVIP